MKDHLRHHAKHMAIGGAVVLVVLLAVGVSWAEAGRWALLLACPLGMIAMMVVMGRRSGPAGGTGEHVHGGHEAATPTSGGGRE